MFCAKLKPGLWFHGTAVDLDGSKLKLQMELKFSLLGLAVMCSVMLNEENLFSILFLFTRLSKMTNG